MKDLFTVSQIKLRLQGYMVIWYLSIFIASMVLVNVALVKTGVFTPEKGGMVYRMGSAIFFLLAMGMKFKEDFDFLLTMGQTRQTIFWSTVVSSVVYTVFFGALITVEWGLISHLNRSMGFLNPDDPFIYFSPYAQGSAAGVFFYFWMLGLAWMLGGFWLGSLFYRYGKRFMTIFWIVFSAVPTLIIPFGMWILARQEMLKGSLQSFGRYMNTFNIPLASLSTFIVAVALAGLTWLNMRHLEQR